MHAAVVTFLVLAGTAAMPDPGLDQLLAKELEAVRKQVGEGFIVETVSPFVVAGDISRAQFDRFKKHTIGGCMKALYHDFFTARHTAPLRIYLFKNDASYKSHAKKLFGDKPSTPFGYYSAPRRSLIMNIGTGGGTLVHEMVHALIEPDFPDVPAWFNEGLGSLFEQCNVRGESIYGLLNWRLPVLHKAVKDKQTIPLAKLFATTDRQFYGKGSGVHYAQARYLCLYMQEKGILRKFYKSFRDGRKKDPTGARFVEEVFGKKVAEIEKEWLAWVATLKWRR